MSDARSTEDGSWPSHPTSRAHWATSVHPGSRGDYYPPTDLDGFLAAYASDDNDWWRLQAGDQMNLFDDAIERLRQAEAEVERLRALHDPDKPGDPDE